MVCPISRGHEKGDLVDHRGAESSETTLGDTIVVDISVCTVV